MTATDVPHDARGWLDLLSEVLSKMLTAVGDAASHLFDALWPHVVNGWNIARKFVIAHPQAIIALVILVFGILLLQPLAWGVVTKILGFTPSGVQAGSIAAQIQACLYGGYVPAGSIFSRLQSFGVLAKVV